MQDATDPKPLSFTEVLDIIEQAGRAERVTLGEILAAFGERAFGPFLLVPALVAVLPVVGALPAVSLATAAIDLAVSVQLVLGQRGLHLPARVRHLGVPRRMLSAALRLIRPVAHWAGRLVHPRLRALTNGHAHRAVGVLALLLSVLMLIGALVPGGIVLPAIAMIILSLGLTSRDGVLILIALGFGLGSLGLGFWWLVLR